MDLVGLNIRKGNFSVSMLNCIVQWFLNCLLFYYDPCYCQLKSNNNNNN